MWVDEISPLSYTKRMKALDPLQLRKLYGENVKALRLELGLTQQELADRLKISQPYVAKIEAGLAWPYALTFSRIADVLGVIPSVLLHDSTKPALTDIAESV